MAQSARLRRRQSRSDQGKGSKKRSGQSKQPSRAAKNKKRESYHEEVEGAAEEGVGGEAEAEEGAEELFKVEKIVDSKLDRNGVPLYKTRWKGYSAGDDTWEPTANVASTGHVDRYERQQRQKSLKKSSAGVAVIEYEDGEREMVDMKIEKFRGYRPDSSDDDRDDDTENGDDDVNNFNLIAEGKWIEILWRHTIMYFPCKIIFWTPIRAKKSHKKGAGSSSRKRVFEDVDESSVAKSKQASMKPTSKRQERGDDSASRSKRQKIGPPTKKSQPELTSKRQMRRDDTTGREKNGIGSAVTAQSDDNSKPMSDLKKLAQKMPSRNEREPTKLSLKAGQKEQDHGDLDDHSIHSESSILSDDIENYSDRHVERIGHGVPLFDEPEDDFSSDNDSEDDVEDGAINANQHPYHHDGPKKLSFEELWMLKLKRTQELIDRGSKGSSGVC